MNNKGHAAVAAFVGAGIVRNLARDGMLAEPKMSRLPAFQTRCRGGCDYIQELEVHSLNGEQVGVRILKDRCPQCDGRLMELFYSYVGRRHDPLPAL